MSWETKRGNDKFNKQQNQDEILIQVNCSAGQQIYNNYTYILLIHAITDK